MLLIFYFCRTEVPEDLFPAAQCHGRQNLFAERVGANFVLHAVLLFNKPDQVNFVESHVFGPGSNRVACVNGSWQCRRKKELLVGIWRKVGESCVSVLQRMLNELT